MIIREMKTNLCPICNQTIRSNTAYCSHCGANLASPIRAGKILHSRYTILGDLGKGGMGALYLASETIARQTRMVVIKEMLEYYDPGDPDGHTKAIRRFEAEAGTLASLSINGVPQVFDFFSESGKNFIVMQFIEGQNLEKKLTHIDDNGNIVPGHSYPPALVREWGIRVCKVLESLATQDIVHMDIKPANLILDRNSEIWLVDFGTSKGKQLSIHSSTVSRKKSSVFGTIGYAPPEQSKGKPEPKSDVFALAATLYHLLTDDDPRDKPYKFNQMGRIPGDLRNALQKALAKDINQRISAHELHWLLETKTTSGPVFRWRNGTVSYRPEDLVHPADNNWEEARMYFKGGEWRHWFKDLHRNDILAQLEQVQRNETDLDLALDSFLRLLDPSLPDAQLSISQTSLNAGDISWRKSKSVELEIHNKGSGCLRCLVANLSGGLSIRPAEFAVQDSRRIDVVVDADLLSPSSKPYILSFKINAGNAGQEQVQVSVIIPEPDIRIDPPHVKISASDKRGEVKTTLTVSNQGGSAFLASLSTKAQWISIDPTNFLCSPGSSYKIIVYAAPDRLRFGRQATEITLNASADKWNQKRKVVVSSSISPIKYFRENISRPLLWIFGWITYGLFFGALLGFWLGGISISGSAYAVLTGILLGTLICVSLSTVIGAMGGFGYRKGRAGARLGAMLGLGPGVIIGGIIGWLASESLNWLNISMNTDLGLSIFGALVGASSCLMLGIITWKVGERGN